MRIDLNCDMGESFGPYTIGNDAEIFPFITSANIACGFHAGDPQVMRQSVQLAKSHGVQVGAHPGYQDLAGFGRRELKLSSQQLYNELLYQLGALQAIAAAEGVALQHVKPHGALYNAAHRDRDIASAVVEAVSAFNPKLALFTLPAGALPELASQRGIRVVREFFADRNYQPDGSLLSRHLPEAVIRDPEVAADRVIRMLETGQIASVSGEKIPMQAETICIHGDEPTAVRLAERLRTKLEQSGVVVKAIGTK